MKLGEKNRCESMVLKSDERVSWKLSNSVMWIEFSTFYLVDEFYQ